MTLWEFATGVYLPGAAMTLWFLAELGYCILADWVEHRI